MLLRNLWVMLSSRWKSKLHFSDVGRMTMRVVPGDLDVLNHVNNGVYLSLMDLGRFNLLIRSGQWQKLRSVGWYPVAANISMTYRRSLQPWQRYVLETKFLGFDEKAMYVEQRFVADGEVYAVGIMRARFLKRSGGTVTNAELGDLAGIDPTTMPIPQWIADWAAGAALPPAKASFPSDWDQASSTV